MQVRQLLILVSSIVVCAAALAIVATNVGAHGDAQWIADNNRYVDRNGRHCCGVDDCRREHATKFREAPEGIYVATGSGGVDPAPRRRAADRATPGRPRPLSSIDDDWWICINRGDVVCVFKPTTGG